MICVECSAPIGSLYERYKGNHIRLTVCSNCHQVADRYIEYDKVLLFIDLMLLKPQAYKHAIYNLLIIDRRYEHPCDNIHRKQMERSNSKIVQANKLKSSTSSKSKLRSPFMDTYGFVLRLTVLLLLFEVYIMWAYEEKNYVENAIPTSLVIRKVLNGPLQYFFFLSTTVLEYLILNVSVALMVGKYLHFGEESVDDIKATDSNAEKASRSLPSSTSLSPDRALGIIVTTILISNTIKLFPIVMLIWPYDIMILNVTRLLVQCVHLAILIEGIHIVLLHSAYNQYWRITLIVLGSELIKFTVSHFIIDCVFSRWHAIPASELVLDELNQITLKIEMIKKLIRKILIYLGI
ncbi:DEKNAAC105382 [Brettanomyces naardenensis]|uniref:Protein ARV n=1 Tax=Brettanomyces naardenensis TaxID=13370 RepID=A0A448YT65_BRENA|nr:DEKNAAC105382 [Brettanomyces naardenensis]